MAGVLEQRAAEQEQDRTDFLKLKQQLEMEFNQKRAKFKELYLSKEGNILFTITADEPVRDRKLNLKGSEFLNISCIFK